jgi:biotin carboxyl carrier protein
MTLMTREAENDLTELSLPDYPDRESSRVWSRSSIGDRALSADAGSDFVRARMPAPQPQPSGDRRVIDSPPLRDDRHPDQDGESERKPRSQFLKRHPVLLALGLALFAGAAALGYLYWDYASRFQTTDDAFIAARAFSMAPKVSGYITAVPVTDNQHVGAGDVIARIDDRDYRVALDQAKAQLARDQALLEQAQKNLDRYQFLVQRNAIAQQQADDQGFLVDQDKSTIALDQAKVAAAELDLSHTTITAAEPGRVVSLTAAVGQFAQAGTALTMFVPDCAPTCNRCCCSASCKASAAAAWCRCRSRFSPARFRRKSAARVLHCSESPWSWRRWSGPRSAAGSPTIFPGSGASSSTGQSG